MKEYTNIWQRLFSGSGWAVFTMFVWELVEEGVEQLIAVALSGAVAIFVTKALSTLAIITATQGIKLAIKHAMVPFIKTFTYKKGNDKMSIIKNIFKWTYANKKTLVGTLSAGLAIATGSGIIDISNFDVMMIGEVNITPYVYYACLGILILIGVFSKGFESIKDFFLRIAKLKETKEEMKCIKQATKELKLEAKENNASKEEQEKQNKKQQKIQAKKEERQRRLAEYRAKIDAIKEKLKQDSSQE